MGNLQGKYMDNLNLPAIECKFQIVDNRSMIFDFVRKKYVVLTPEEWVRQHFVHFLINELRYPRTLIKLEGGLRYNSMQRRSDIVIYNRSGKPHMIIECKASSVKISQRVFEQVAVYNKTLGAGFMVVTNGLAHFCCQIDHQSGSYRFMDHLPSFE